MFEILRAFHRRGRAALEEKMIALAARAPLEGGDARHVACSARAA
jgi:hypothetical protein